MSETTHGRDLLDELEQLNPEAARVFRALVAKAVDLVRSDGEHGADELLAEFSARFGDAQALLEAEGQEAALEWLDAAQLEAENAALRRRVDRLSDRLAGVTAIASLD